MTLRTSGFLVAFLIAFSAFADDAVPARQKAHASEQRVFLDPVTGQPRSPTAEERQQMRQQKNEAATSEKSAEIPKVVEYPDGSVGVFHKRPQNQLHAVIGKDGKVKTYCKDQPAKKAKP